VNLCLASLGGRAHLVDPERTFAVDLERMSDGRFSADPMANFGRWDELRDFARLVQISGNVEAVPVTPELLDAPAPRPTQLVAVGLNYRNHAIEFGAPIPTSPVTFTKFPSAINTPNGDVTLVGETCDWEAEMVLVVGRGGRDIPRNKAWDAIAGVCVGQDFTNRTLQMASQPPQFSLGKSHKGFAPFGPWVVDAATLASRDSLDISCTLNGEIVQQANTKDFIFDVSEIVAYLSSIIELRPGDLVYTGTPSGIGQSRTPQMFLKPGDTVVTTLEGVGSITSHCI
jgi:2-keto-4-pentenoate hydratase/2-oxohepta-3-ene-1,7-dioic acid hydratase in catechol pathway